MRFITHLCVGTTTVATVDSKRSGFPSIFHKDCEVLVESSEPQKVLRCQACVKHRKLLCTMAACTLKDDGTSHSSHTTYANLHSFEKDQRLHNMAKELSKFRQRNKHLKKRIDAAVKTVGVTVDSALHNDLKEVMEKETDKVYAAYPEELFPHLFLEQQQKAASLKDARSMKWHPLIIKWCLYLRHLSGKAYELLRKTGAVSLPSQSTLRDYTHYVSTMIGFSAEIDKQLLDLVSFDKEYNRYVTLVMDEVHIREDLVYDKNEGTLIGFVNLGETNNHLVKYEASLDGDYSPTIAKSMMVLMVRGLISKLNFPYAQFACADLSGDLLFDPVREGVSKTGKTRI